MTNRSSRGSEQPEKAVALRRSINDRDLIRELHQGPRSCGRTPRPNTWLHPTKALKDQNPLATQAPSTQGLTRSSRTFFSHLREAAKLTSSVYRPQFLRHRFEAYAASAAAGSCLFRTAFGV
jgi:hypothetical protein